MQSFGVEEEVWLACEGIVVVAVGGMNLVGCNCSLQALDIPTVEVLKEDLNEEMMDWIFVVVFGLPHCTSSVVQPDYCVGEGRVDLVEVSTASASEGGCAFD